MKKVIALVLSLCVILSCASPVFAAQHNMWDSGGVLDSGDINIGSASGNDVELRGNVVPTILSVTMPSYIPFDISRSLSTENKVVSPRITVQNNSTAPVTIYVDNTKIDLSEMPYVSWNTNQYCYGSQIAIGLVESYTEPSQLYNVKWLQNGKQNTNLTLVYPYASSTLYVAGALGEGVPENKGFSVVATLVARQG